MVLCIDNGLKMARLLERDRSEGIRSRAIGILRLTWSSFGRCMSAWPVDRLSTTRHVLVYPSHRKLKINCTHLAVVSRDNVPRYLNPYLSLPRRSPHVHQPCLQFDGFTYPRVIQPRVFPRQI